MSNSLSNGGDTADDRKDAAAQQRLEQLRRLIVGPTDNRLEDVEQQLDDPDQQASAISQVLPKAVALGASRDDKLASALEPILENAIRTSIKKDRRILVDALFPVMGPAIRKAIASTIQGLIQNFNQILEHSLSIRGLRWRIEALRTRRPFAEVVLLHTLVYQVEQVFLIHRDSGLLVDHLVAKTAVAQNPDLVSGMMTAIKDFVQDSFGAAQEDTLDTFQVGERKIWIEHGAYAMLAVVIRGNPPVDLREMMRDALDEIHLKYSDTLAAFNGDSQSFESVHPILNGLLQVQFKSQEKKSYFHFWLVAAVIAMIIGWLVFQQMSVERRWRQYTDQVRRQPGIVVTQVKSENGRRHIYGLKDPYAPDPALLIEPTGISIDAVVFHWEPYPSAHPEFALKRARILLVPPPTIRFTFDQGTLQASGAALNRWIETSRQMARVATWIDHYTDDEVIDIDSRLDRPTTITLALEGTMLVARGSASHAWITRARQIAAGIPGVSEYNDDQVVNLDAQSWDLHIQAISDTKFYFKPGLVTLTDGQDSKAERFYQTVKQLVQLAHALDQSLRIEVIGHADQVGDEAFNIDLSRRRAQYFADQLIAAGVEAGDLALYAAGSSLPAVVGSGQMDRALNRRVSFKVNSQRK